MERFRKILVVVHPNRPAGAAVARAFALGARTGAAIKLLEVLEPPPRWLAERRAASGLGSLADQILEERQRRLDALLAASDPGGERRAEAAVVFGTTLLEVTREVVRGGHDLVITAVPGAPRARQPLPGDVMQLLRKCPAAVWVVRTDGGEPLRRVVAAVDVGTDGERPERGALNRRVAQLARWLAANEGAALSLAHVWNTPGPHLLGAPWGFTPREIGLWSQEIEAERRVALERLAEQHELRGLPLDLQLLCGETAFELAALVVRQDADLVIMGTVCRSGLSGLLIGNTAENVLQLVSCSVLAIKPPGFVSPVRVDA